MSKIQISIVLASTVLTVSAFLPAVALASTPDVSSNITGLSGYLQSQQVMDGRITGFGGETSLAIMGFVSVGINPHTVQNGGVSLLDFLAANPPSSLTGWERDLLAVTAAGENPFTFGGHNYVANIEAFANGGQIGSTTTLNDDFFGILALTSAGPSADQQVISDAITFVINNQNVDGGWSWSVGGASDSNDTAIAVMALKAAQGAGFSNSGLATSISEGVDYLTGLQQPDGGWEYQSGFGTDAGSTAWVVLALLGDDGAVTDGLNFIVSKQDASGGIDGGFGVDTYTSANSLIAFGQTAFPVGAFESEFLGEDPQAPGDPEDPQDEDTNIPSAPNDDDGKVLSATNTNEDGKVLAATLPNTGIYSKIKTSPKSEATNSQNRTRLFGLFLALGGSLILVGLSLRYFLRKASQ